MHSFIVHAHHGLARGLGLLSLSNKLTLLSGRNALDIGKPLHHFLEIASELCLLHLAGPLRSSIVSRKPDTQSRTHVFRLAATVNFGESLEVSLHGSNEILGRMRELVPNNNNPRE